MAMEDVDYLSQHSVKKSYMFYIDSADRDKNTWPHPNTYSIQFSAPFKNVYSLEILDASIPRTQYAIDIHNNSLVYKYESNPDLFTLKIPVGDYSDKNLINVINQAFSDNSHNITIRNVSIPADERSTFIFDSTVPFIIDANNSTLRTVLGFDLHANNNNLDEFANPKYELFTEDLINYNPNLDVLLQYTANQTDIANHNTIDVSHMTKDDFKRHQEILAKLNQTQNEINLQISNYKNRLFKSILGANFFTYLVFEGPLATNTSFVLNSNVSFSLGSNEFSDSESFNAIAQTFRINEGTDFNNFEIFFNESRSVTFGFVVYSISKDNRYTEISTSETSFALNGNYAKVEFKSNVAISSGNYIIVIFNPRDTNSGPGSENFEPDTVSAENVNICVSSYVSEYKLYALNYTGILNTDGTTLKSGEETATELENFGLCININTSENAHSIEAPGMYNLIGDRYAILRCPEIEQHLFASHSFEKYSMGLAKFKLAVLGYDESRFDFATLPPREFHPIGKLTQMTFRFERPDGGLYNFRGINHTITLAVRYMVPIQERNFEQFSLNPQYNPDFFKYQQNDTSGDDTDSD